MKNYNEKSNKLCFFVVDVQYTVKLHDLYNDLLFSPERMAIENIEKLVANLHNKTEYVIHTRNSNQALSHRLFLKTVPRMIQFSQNA